MIPDFKRKTVALEPYQTALILGAGRSGRAAKQLLEAEGTAVLMLTEERDTLPTLTAKDFDICIVSPGFALTHPWIESVTAAGIPLLSELELGWSRHSGETVAVTGSNGKSTAVKWIQEMFVRAGLKAEIGGNYGIPACEVVLEHPTLDWLVLEVSSFQLETVQKFYAEVAVLLNVLPNHLNRHGTMECYRRIKEQIFAHAPADATGIVPHQLLADRNPNQLNWVSFGAAKKADFFYHDGQIFHRNQPVLDLRDTLFSGHTLGSCTGAAVAAVAAACSIPFSVVEATARAFKPLPHRLQRLGSRDGVEYVNDSKATNLAAMAAGLEACGKSIHLIAGGVPKESDYTFLKEILAERVQSIYLVGQVSRTMYRAWNLVCPCIECGTVKTAFITARKAAQAGETILLSPGCASFDQFRNFEERGAHFMALFNGRDME